VLSTCAAGPSPQPRGTGRRIFVTWQPEDALVLEGHMAFDLEQELPLQTDGGPNALAWLDPRDAR
jgi:hypothetical protein